MNKKSMFATMFSVALIAGAFLFVTRSPNLPDESSSETFVQIIKPVYSEYSTNRSGTIYFYDNNIGNLQLRGVDVGTFNVLGYEYAKDKNNVYFRSTILPEADPESFSILPSTSSTSGPYMQIFRDSFNVYYQGRIITNIDNSTFEYIGGPYYKDKEFVYYQYNGNPIQFVPLSNEINPIDFKYFGPCGCVEKSCAYYVAFSSNVACGTNKFTILENADRGSFVITGNDNYPKEGYPVFETHAMDNNNIYIKTKIVPRK